MDCLLSWPGSQTGFPPCLYIFKSFFSLSLLVSRLPPSVCTPALLLTNDAALLLKVGQSLGLSFHMCKARMTDPPQGAVGGWSDEIREKCQGRCPVHIRCLVNVHGCSYRNEDEKETTLGPVPWQACLLAWEMGLETEKTKKDAVGCEDIWEIWGKGNLGILCTFLVTFL